MILLDTIKGKETERPPIWMMRQAGRVLPSYLKIKEKYSFWEMMQKPRITSYNVCYTKLLRTFIDFAKISISSLVTLLRLPLILKACWLTHILPGR